MTKDIMHEIPKENELQEFIEDVLDNAYAGYQEKSTAEVSITPKKEVKICFNTETPYLGEEFWKLANEVSDPIEEKLEEEGYKYRDTDFSYGYLNWCYDYQSNDNSSD